ncbi:MAG TPA: hypothetical protein DCE56_08970, partial [Cyanobacteria bacterium UBA8553]|nr:hypothetical protein [Cyanobacteria bacterium UBA8553]
MSQNQTNWDEEAMANYDKALAINPDDYSAWNNKGIALARVGQSEEAVASFDKAL